MKGLSNLWSLYLRILAKGQPQKNYSPLSLLVFFAYHPVVVKSLKKLVKKDLFIT